MHVNPIFYVYILECADGSYYIGVTNELNKRVNEHQIGKHPGSYTYERRPVELVFYTSFTDPENAINFEKKIKGWSRAKKKALIDENYDLLPLLAKKKFK